MPTPEFQQDLQGQWAAGKNGVGWLCGVRGVEPAAAVMCKPDISTFLINPLDSVCLAKGVIGLAHRRVVFCTRQREPEHRVWAPSTCLPFCLTPVTGLDPWGIVVTCHVIVMTAMHSPRLPLFAMWSRSL